MPTFDSDGLTIHYESFGDGKPIMLVHGFASSLEGNWVRTGWIEALTPIRRVVALDCRGHGESDKPYDPEAYAGDAMSNDVIRLMDHLEIENADLFGYSMGGGISLRLLSNHPKRFTSGVLGGVGNVFARSRSGRPGVSDAMLAKDASKISNPSAKGFRVFAEANKSDLKALSAYQQARRTPLGGATLDQISVPVLIVNGEADALVGSPDELAAAIPGARLVMVPDRDHLTVVPDQRFKDAVIGFLNEGSPA